MERKMSKRERMWPTNKQQRIIKQYTQKKTTILGKTERSGLDNIMYIYTRRQHKQKKASLQCDCKTRKSLKNEMSAIFSSRLLSNICSPLFALFLHHTPLFVSASTPFGHRKKSVRSRHRTIKIRRK